MNTVQSLINGFFEACCPEGLKASVRAEMLALTVEQMKDEIRADGEEGLVPHGIRSFAELHDHVDANEYGGFCDDERAEELRKFFSVAEEDDGMSEDLIAFVNDAQNAVDAWLKAMKPS